MHDHIVNFTIQNGGFQVYLQFLGLLLKLSPQVASHALRALFPHLRLCLPALDVLGLN